MHAYIYYLPSSDNNPNTPYDDMYIKYEYVLNSNTNYPPRNAKQPPRNQKQHPHPSPTPPQPGPKNRRYGRHPQHPPNPLHKRNSRVQ